jgi:PAS domain S-box-containing protein
VLSLAVLLFVGVFAIRIAWSGDSEPILLLNVVPLTLVAVQFGFRAGLAAGVITCASWAGYRALEDEVSLAAVLIRLPVFLLPGALIGWLRDVDAEHLRALAESEKDLRFIAEESTDMISTHTADGDYVFVSGSCRDLLGYTPEEMIGSSAYAYFCADDVETVQASHANTLAQPEVFTTTYRIRAKDGTYVWVESKSRARRSGETGEVEEIHCATREAAPGALALELQSRSRSKARSRIEQVIAGEELSIVYQPIRDLESGQTVAVEALARFAGRPSRPPNEWFGEAWQAELGVELETLAIRRAVEGARAFPPEWAISLNASPVTVLSPLLLEALGNGVERAVIEVTEHADLVDLEAFKRAAGLLREHGARLAIDDVGAGFSGLSRLLDLSPQVLKLDLSLVRGIHEDQRRKALTSALVAFGREARVEVIAEGIETESELAALRSLGVRYGQGYYLQRPAPASAILALSQTQPRQTAPA